MFNQHARGITPRFRLSMGRGLRVTVRVPYHDHRWVTDGSVGAGYTHSILVVVLLHFVFYCM